VRIERLIQTARQQRFDVICAGHLFWRGSLPFVDGAPRSRDCAFVDVTKMLLPGGLRVAWAAVLEDDRRSRALLAEASALDVDVRGVVLAPSTPDLVVVDVSGAWSGRAPEGRRPTPFELPESWSSQVLLLSGLAPVTASLADFCKSARRARRDGTFVVLDLAGSPRAWFGRDPRLLGMVLREADVVRCSFFDLAAIGTDAEAVRRAMRSDATLVLDDEAGATATGPFGEVRVEVAPGSSVVGVMAESFTAAICVEHAKPRGAGESAAGRWHRILRNEAPTLAIASRLQPRGA
jgi:hypothetical protein